MTDVPLSERMDGRVALVTGASRGIGRACALALAARGAAVAVHYRERANAAEEVVGAILSAGGVAEAFQCDLGDAGAADELVASVARNLGSLDVLVNNAGGMTTGAVVDTPDAMWDRVIAVNLTSVFRLCRAAIPGMTARGWGRIIMMSSQSAFTGSANHAAYATTKAGLLGFTFSLAKELGMTGITVNCVSPGRITTDMLADIMRGREEEWLRQTPLRRIGEPTDVGAAVAFLASDAARYITGANLHVNGGLVMG